MDHWEVWNLGEKVDILLYNCNQKTKQDLAKFFNASRSLVESHNKGIQTIVLNLGPQFDAVKKKAIEIHFSISLIVIIEILSVSTVFFVII